MKAIIVSTEDPASINIRDRLLEMEKWDKKGSFRDMPAYFYGEYAMLQHSGPHIYAEGIDRDISAFLGERPEVLIFASMHKSESGKSCLTVHPVGNYGKAEFGGKERMLSMSSPEMMTEALRLMEAKNTLDDFSVSYEVTHHGPYLEIPAFFIEIGSKEEEWSNRMAGELISEVLLELERFREKGEVIAIGIGGGHYAPRFTDIALQTRVSFGHMAPGYAVKNLDEDMLKQMVSRSRAKYVYFHKAGLKRSEISRFSSILEDIGIKRARSMNFDKI